ncbi:hypothetical protein BX616_007937 [Lobosporangium transversale]|nr:hypothetical protein BX616_007937 [Lobosporangium transversale]
MGDPGNFLSSFVTISHNIMTARRSKRYILILVILAVVFLTLTFSNRSRDVLDYGGYLGLDNNQSGPIKKPTTEPDSYWRGKTVVQEIILPEATWTCTDDQLPINERITKNNRRSRQCVVQNLCAFIRKNGIFRKNLPEVNLMSSDEESDVYWQPRLERSWRKTIRAHYVNETLFVHGLYSPYHFSHWLYNGMMPLYSTMKRFGGTKDSWSLRAGRFKYDPIERQGSWEMEHFFQSGKELVLNKEEISTAFQSLPPADAPICFRRAVIGLGSQCALDYCEHNIPTEVYKHFRDEIAQYYWSTPQVWQNHLETTQKAILKRQRLSSVQQKERRSYSQPQKRTNNKRNEEQSSHAKEMSLSQSITKRQQASDKEKPNSQLRCLDLARYYNFNGAGPNHGLEKEESSKRVGQLQPDVVDAEKDYINLYADVGKSSKRKVIVGIIQREKSRRIINDESLIQSLVQAGFRVKWMSFDHGCGLAETAYLLRDVNVLISPHGNAIGTSVFMPSYGPIPTLISIDTSRYWEPWFKHSATALGQRFVNAVCGPHNYPDEATKERCPFYKDVQGAKHFVGHLVLGLPESILKSDEEKRAMEGEELEQLRNQHREYVATHPEAQKLAEQELDVLIGPEVPQDLINKYGGDDTWRFLGNFWKAIPRYVDVPRVLKFIEGLQQDLEEERRMEAAMREKRPNMSSTDVSSAMYVSYVKKGQACGFESCGYILKRNVMDGRSAFGKHSIDNITLWGQPRAEIKTLLQGLTEAELQIGWKIE